MISIFSIFAAVKPETFLGVSTVMWTFLISLMLLGVFLYYLVVEDSRKKRISGTFLCIVLPACALAALYPPDKKIKQGIDIQGGSSFTVQLLPKLDEKGAPVPLTQGSVEKAIEILSKRLNPDGTRDVPPPFKQGEDRIVVQMPGVKDEEIAGIREQISKVAKLEFRLVHPNSFALAPRVKSGAEIIPGWTVMEGTDAKDGPYLVKSRPDLEGKLVQYAYASFDPEGWVVGLNFNSEGAKRFGEITTQHVHERLAVVVDGKVQSAPNLNEPILGGSARISGKFTEIEARDLAVALQNPLENPLKIIDESVVSATYGADTIRKGVVAGLAGLGFTLFFLLFYYRLPGLIAVGGLIINLCLLLGLIALFGFTLTMQGIAGMILTVSMSVDANVLIYERLREELKAGKSVSAALEASYNKAFTAIFDSNVTTLITAVVLFLVGSAILKGFAITLIVGILTSLFSALLVTRVLFMWAVHSGKLKELKTMDFFPKTTFDFMAWGRRALLFSLALCLGTIVLGVLRGKNAVGVDFRGGASITANVAAGQTLTGAEVEQSMKSLTDIGETFVQQQSSAGNQFIKVRGDFEAGTKIEAKLKEDFGARISGYKIEGVGGFVGDELARQSLYALLLGMGAILLFMAFRFELSFAIGALFALLHDVILVTGAIFLVGQEISLVHVGALLTIGGYSIYDTIVVYDRIRGELIAHEGDRLNMKEIMNLAIADTLSRTVLIGLTTFVSVLMIYFFGGPALEAFSLCIFVGIVVGTYSSIFIAAPVVLWASRLRGRDLHSEIKATQAMLDISPQQKEREVPLT